MAFTTRKSLLAKVRSGDEVSWREFYAAYKPLILLCGRDCSLTPDENDELVQQVMTEIFQKDVLSKYDIDKVPDNVVFKHDPARGRFRYFLKKIIRNQAIKIYHKRQMHEPLEKIPEISEAVWESTWNQEWQRYMLTMALTELKNKVQEETFLAFEMYALQERPVGEVAAFLGLSVSSVYTAKSRCVSALREIMKNF